MTTMEFAKTHCQRFGYEKPAEISMIVEWAEEHAKSGATMEDLENASKAMLKSTAQTFRREQHLQQMNSLLISNRDKRINLENGYKSTPGYRCSVCRDARGIVSVPLLKQIDCGIWTGKQTQAVVCDCVDGDRWRNTKNSKDQPMMTLGEYERRNPLWRSQLRDRLQFQAGQNLVLERARNLDGKGVNKLDQALANILARITPATLHKPHLEDGRFK